MWLVAGNDWAGCSPSPEISLSFLLSLPLCVLVRVWECGHWWNYSIKVQDERWNIQRRAAAAAEEITWRSKHHVCCTSSLSVYPLFLWVKEIYWDVEDYIYIRFWVKSDELCLTFSCTVQQEGALWISELSEVKVRLILQLSGLNPYLKAQHNY